MTTTEEHFTTVTAKVLVPTGMLGAGVDADLLRRGVEMGADVIAVDGGSTDSGPYYLGASVAKTARAAVARDMQLILDAAVAGKIPVIIGSCGTSGTDDGVDWVAGIVAEWNAGREPLRVARIYSEQARDDIVARLDVGDIKALAPAGALDHATIEKCDHIVGLMGHDPIASAIEAGADVVLAGRATDTAVLAALPLLRGCPPGPTWHAAKIAECGGLCTATPHLGGVLVTIDHGGFEIEPLHPDGRCTPTSVAAHMLYENADPYVMREPAGFLDATHAEYRAIDDRVVRVEGSQFHPAPDGQTIKLEGSGVVGYETMSLVGIRDEGVLLRIDEWTQRLEYGLESRVASLLGLGRSAYDVVIRRLGLDAVLGKLDPSTDPPREVGIVLIIRAADQATATAIAKIANPILLHLPLEGMTHLPSYAFLTSPAEVERGPVYEFLLQHAVDVKLPDELFRTTIGEVEHA